MRFKEKVRIDPASEYRSLNMTQRLVFIGSITLHTDIFKLGAVGRRDAL
jgi:hypothetical protein